MALSWTGAVALANKIVNDVPAIKTMLDSVAKMDFTALANLPENAKRMASVTGGMQLQKLVSGAWITVGKLMHDVDTVDGFHAGTGMAKNTIPVRDANGELPGNITGNAATATSAQVLSKVNPIARGGTGASTAAEARKNLGVVTATTSALGLVRPDGQTVLADTVGTLSVPLATEDGAGLIRGDNITVVTDNGIAYAQDLAIGGDTGDLASQRGQIGTPPIQSFTKTSADDAATLNMNDDKWWVNGEYSLYLRGDVFSFIPVVNNTPLEVSGNYSARLRVANVYHTGNGIQEFSIAIGGRVIRMYHRARFFNSDNTFSYYPWREAILTSNLGDGIRNTNGIISVPEYQGATVSAPGTSGLVPPAAAGEQGHALTGGGDWVEMLRLSGGTMSGAIVAASTLSKVLCGSTAAQRLHYCGGTSFSDGGYFVAEGKDGSLNPGGFEATATNGIASHSLIGKINGILTWDGNVIDPIRSKIIADNGYILFASGLQICWGSARSNTTVSFLRAFKRPPCATAIHTMGSSGGWAIPIGVYPTATTIYCKDDSSQTKNENAYLAIGEGA